MGGEPERFLELSGVLATLLVKCFSWSLHFKVNYKDVFDSLTFLNNGSGGGVGKAGAGSPVCNFLCNSLESSLVMLYSSLSCELFDGICS